jgi:hypothetical protein
VALKSDGAAEKPKDQLSRDFLGCSIFDFCNNICHKQTHAPQQFANYSINSSAWASNGGGETERLGGLEVDRQFELYWGLNRKLAHFVTPQDAI